MNHASVDSWFKQSSIYDAKAIYEKYKDNLEKIEKYNENNPSTKKKLPTIIFGSRENFIKRCKHKITKKEFTINRVLPLVSVGEALPKGNRKFELRVMEENKIIFKPARNIKIELQLPHLRKNYQKILYDLQTSMEQKKLPVKISLDFNYIYLIYDENLLTQPNYAPVKNRLMAIDMNPNYIGYSIIDWKAENDFNIIKTGVISIKKLNDKQQSFKKEKISSDNPKNIKINNQRRFEIFEISKALSETAKANNVEGFGLETLDMKSSDKGKGSKYNRLVNNQWLRSPLENNLHKRLNLIGIKFIGSSAAYSSFVGNMLYRQFPDMAAASIEINRRAYLKLNSQFNFGAIFPSFTRSTSALIQSLEELGLEAFKLIQKVKGWKDLYGIIKNLELRYRAL